MKDMEMERFSLEERVASLPDSQLSISCEDAKCLMSQ